jgi:RimJ/RimL family protein N-acetyltransferase
MDRVYLRPFRPDDLTAIYHWHNSEELYQTLIGPFRRVPIEAVQEWLAERSTPSATELSLAICRTSDSKHIGNIYLKDVDCLAGDAELHMFIGDPEERGQGFGTAAVRLMLRRVIDELHLKRVHLAVFEDNEAAIRLYRRCGFAVEATLRNQVVKNGQFKNVILMGIRLTSGGVERIGQVSPRHPS